MLNTSLQFRDRINQERFDEVGLLIYVRVGGDMYKVVDVITEESNGKEIAVIEVEKKDGETA